jgi:PPOX class probable F420-dependent enzyme
MTLGSLPAWAGELIVVSKVGRLAFADGDDHPRVLPVTYAVAREEIWTAIDRKPKRTPEPARVRWLRRRPRAAFCIDVYDDDWSRLAWVQVLGRIEVVELAAGAPGVEALADKYPQYREAPPPGPLLRLAPERALCWRAADYSNSISSGTSST